MNTCYSIIIWIENIVKEHTVKDTLNDKEKLSLFNDKIKDQCFNDDFYNQTFKSHQFND